jgi:uncharacterized protein YjbJ (UPF0337 family)
MAPLRSLWNSACRRNPGAARKVLVALLEITGEGAMSRTQIEGQWHQLMGQVKSQWAKLTDDEFKNVAGKREQLIGKLRERYGM